MVEELFEMYKRAKTEAAFRCEQGDFSGYLSLMAFAFRCKQLAADIMSRPVIGFEF